MALVKLQPKDYISEIPSFPDFPYAEYRSRVNRVKELMNENEIDCLLVWKEQNVRYFFGYNTTHWHLPPPHPGVGIIPVDGEPILVVPDLLLPNAQGFCWTREIWSLPSAHLVSQQRQLPKDVAVIVKEIGYERKNIALEMGPLGGMWIPRPLNDIEAMKAELPKAKFVNGDKVIWGCRMIKSSLEIDRIRQAASVIRRCHAAVIDQFRPGMTEMDVAKIIHHVQVDSGDFRGGDTCVIAHIVCNLEKEGMCDILALDDVTITKEDNIQLDLQHRHKGYWADIARIYQVGPITDKMKRNYELCAETLADAAAAVKPGVPASEVYRAGIKKEQAVGIRPMEMIGHGIGLDIHEPPDIDGETDILLEEGMVIALEMWILTSFKRNGGEGIFGIENQYVVTDKGYELISGLDQNIIQVAHPFE